MDAERRKWAALGVLCLSLLIVSIDNGILNVALPTLVRQLGATPSQLQWIVDAYTLVFAGLLLTGGSLGDRFGRRGVVTVGLVIFGAGSMAASLSTTPNQLIIWRAVMGVGAALIMPGDAVDPRQRLHRGTGAASGDRVLVAHERDGRLHRPGSRGAAAGALLVGIVLLGQRAGRRDGVGAPAFPRADVAQSRGRPISISLGAALSMLALGALLWGIIEGPVRGWSSPAIVGVVRWIARSSWSRSSPGSVESASPMIDIATFRTPQLTAAAAAMTIAFIAMTGSMFLIVQSLQIVKGYIPAGRRAGHLGSDHGGQFSADASGAGVDRTLRGALDGGRRIDPDGRGGVGHRHDHRPFELPNLFVGFALMASAFSVFVPASTEAIMTAVPKEMAGGASAINQTTRQLGQALASPSVAASLRRAIGPVSPGPGSTWRPGSCAQPASSITGAIAAARGLARGARLGLLDAAHEAFLHGVRLALVTAAVLALAGALFSALAIPSRRATSEASVPEGLGEGPGPQGVAIVGEDVLHVRSEDLSPHAAEPI